MSSRSCKNDRSVLLIGVACAAVGCGRPIPTATPAPAKVYVNRDALVRLHPLWIEANQLGAVPSSPPETTIRFQQPSAPDSLKIPALVPSPTVQARRSDARNRLEAVQRRGIATYESGRDTRVEDAVEARRLELEASEERALAEREDVWLDEERRRIDAAKGAVATDLAVLQTALDSVDVQLKEGFLVAVSPTVLAQERARLAGSVATIVDERGARRVEMRWPSDIRGVSPRARLSIARDAIATQIAQISGVLDVERREARTSVERAREIAKAEARGRIAREIERVREERRIDLAPLLEQQNFGMLLERTLAMESTPVATLGGGEAQGLARETQWATLRLESNGKRPDVAMATRMRARAAALVDARIADVSRAKNVSAMDRPSAGVPDRTWDFARWMGLQGE